MSLKSFTSRELTLDVDEGDRTIAVTWRGKSTAREPATFLAPVLNDVLALASKTGKEVTMDFRSLEYMNSSTITPLIRVLELARKGSARLTITYARNLKWQELSFSALEMFQTKDGRVKILGKGVGA